MEGVLSEGVLSGGGFVRTPLFICASSTPVIGCVNVTDCRRLACALGDVIPPRFSEVPTRSEEHGVDLTTALCRYD